MNRSDKRQPRPLLGLALLLMAGIVTAVPGAAAAWAGWRLLTR